MFKFIVSGGTGIWTWVSWPPNFPQRTLIPRSFGLGQTGQKRRTGAMALKDSMVTSIGWEVNCTFFCYYFMWIICSRPRRVTSSHPLSLVFSVYLLLSLCREKWVGKVNTILHNSTYIFQVVKFFWTFIIPIWNTCRLKINSLPPTWLFVWLFGSHLWNHKGEW